MPFPAAYNWEVVHVDDKTRNVQYIVPLVVGLVMSLAGASQFHGNVVAVRSGLLWRFGLADSAKFALPFLVNPYGGAVVVVSLWCLDPDRGLPPAKAIVVVAAISAAIQLLGFAAMGSSTGYGGPALVNWILAGACALMGIAVGHVGLMNWRSKLTADS